MIRAVIFDIDGTLIDSVDSHAQAWVDAFRKFGKDIPFDDVRSQIGKGSDQLLPVFLSEAEREEFGEALDRWRGEHMKRDFLPKFRKFPLVRELFQKILADGKRIALASSAKPEELDRYKEIAGIADLIGDDEATSSGDAEQSKPHPDIFHSALAKLDGIDPTEVIVVGDTPYDAEAAGKAGLKAIGVLCGGFPEDVLRRAGCIAIYRDPADLLENYGRSPISG
jgi:HAD superfamily hydrolase (TIGR01549 family)